jgi:hypothetical protein
MRDAILLTKGGDVATVTYVPTSGPRPSPLLLRSSYLPAAVRMTASGLRIDVRPRAGSQVLVCP